MRSGMERGRSNRVRGFSLVELLVSMSIAMVLIAVSFPMATTTLDTYRLHNDARQIAAQCQNARLLAIASNISHRLHRNGNAIELQKRAGASYTLVESFQLAGGISVTGPWSADPVFSPRGTV